jgi:uncharacterized protein
MSVLLQTIVLLTLSNVFMTFAWYGHLGSLKDRPWFVAALVSWGIALFEYLLQVPANRIGNTQFSVSQLKILQEVISLSVFVPIALLYLKEPIRWDYVWAALCICGAVFFVFRGRDETPIPPSPVTYVAPVAPAPPGSEPAGPPPAP